MGAPADATARPELLPTAVLVPNDVRARAYEEMMMALASRAARDVLAPNVRAFTAAEVLAILGRRAHVRSFANYLGRHPDVRRMGRHPHTKRVEYVAREHVPLLLKRPKYAHWAELGRVPPETLQEAQHP